MMTKWLEYRKTYVNWVRQESMNAEETTDLQIFESKELKYGALDWNGFGSSCRNQMLVVTLQERTDGAEGGSKTSFPKFVGSRKKKQRHQQGGVK